MKIYKIQLNQETFSALLTGKKLEQVFYGPPLQTKDFKTSNDVMIEIYPPHYGLYFTHEQINELMQMARIEGAKTTFDMFEKNINKNKPL